MELSLQLFFSICSLAITNVQYYCKGIELLIKQQRTRIVEVSINAQNRWALLCRLTSVWGNNSLSLFEHCSVGWLQCGTIWPTMLHWIDPHRSSRSVVKVILPLQYKCWFRGRKNSQFSPENVPFSQVILRHFIFVSCYFSSFLDNRFNFLFSLMASLTNLSTSLVIIIIITRKIDLRTSTAISNQSPGQLVSTQIKTMGYIWLL